MWQANGPMHLELLSSRFVNLLAILSQILKIILKVNT